MSGSDAVQKLRHDSLRVNFFLRQLLRLDCDFELSATIWIDKSQLQTAIEFGWHLRRHRARNNLVPSRQDDAVAGNPQRTFENNLVALKVITLVVFISLDDCQTIFAAFTNRMGEKDFDVMTRRRKALARVISFILA